LNHNTLGRFGGWALVLLAATQGLLLGLRPWPGSVASDPWLTAGDRPSSLEVHRVLTRRPPEAPRSSRACLSQRNNPRAGEHKGGADHLRQGKGVSLPVKPRPRPQPSENPLRSRLSETQRQR
jgi:hypothetical protein